MTRLLATVLGSPDESNQRGELDGAAWRFVLPREFDTVEWCSDAVATERDRNTLARYTTVLCSEGPSRGVPTRDPADRLVVGPDPGWPSAPRGPVGIDLTSAGVGVPLELRYVGHELRTVAPLEDRAALAVLDAHEGRTGPIPRDLRQRVKGAPRRNRHAVVGSLRGAPAGPPAWLVLAARDAGIDIADHGWALWCRGEYGSQKLVLFVIPRGDTVPSMVAKIVRDPRFSDRLANESAMLAFVGRLDERVRRGAPSLLFHTTIWGSAASAQSAVAGADLRTLLGRRPELVSQVTSWMSALASSTSTAVDRSEVRRSVEELLERYLRSYDVPASVASFLRAQAELLGTLDLCAVAQHGDAGPWNAVVTGAGDVVFLDWEAGETRGLPLWDLFYFLRSTTLLLTRRRSWESRRSHLRRQLVTGDVGADLVATEVLAYVEATALDPAAVEPLYHLCWVQRAVKEARRLPAARRSDGLFHRFLLDGVEGRDLPGIRRMTLRVGGD